MKNKTTAPNSVVSISGYVELNFELIVVDFRFFGREIVIVILVFKFVDVIFVCKTVFEIFVQFKIVDDSEVCIIVLVCNVVVVERIGLNEDGVVANVVVGGGGGNKNSSRVLK